MNTNHSLTAHFEGIESIIIENIENAEQSIFIVMAWLTSSGIKNALLNAKLYNPELTIEIVVDDNKINDKYFLNSRKDFIEAGIIIKPKVDKRFLHRKFMVVDDKITVWGSYNFTRKARYNLENISVAADEHFSKIHKRVFRSLTESDYVDENIKLLFENLNFAQQMLSCYYPFTLKEYKHYYSKIILGNCFTHENGMYDELTYYPGFIFNGQYHFDANLKGGEFQLPINKSLIKNWTLNRNENLIIDSYREFPEQWDEINGELRMNHMGIEKHFKRVVDGTYSYDKLQQLVVNGADIIKEDRLWDDNFVLFLRKDLIDKLFSLFPDVLKDYTFYNSQQPF